MYENCDNLEVGLVKVIGKGDGKVIITKEMRVGDVAPVSVDWIDRGVTIDRMIGN